MNKHEMQARKERGLMIAKTARIEKTDNGWKVPSQYGNGTYTVISNGFEAKCNCPDHEKRKCKCKHIFAVEFMVTKQVDNEGNVTITQTVRKTYKQNWNAYDNAQTNEKQHFMKLLKDITGNIEQPEYAFGRPTLPISDMIYSSVLKTYTTFSLRRFMSDIETAKEKGYVENKPCYASVGHFMQREDITPVLSEMVALTSAPLKAVEHDFAIDSTGFGTSNFQRWFSFKHGKDINSRRWVKCHFMTGVKTNIISSVKVTSEFNNDSPELKGLVAKTDETFEMDEICCDKAYSSRDNHKIIAQTGATPFIPFKKNATGKSRGSLIWSKMYHYFMLNNNEYMEHYHKRSNAETTVHMVKSKFGDRVRSKSWTAQVNEVLCKIICHNICVVVQEMHELGLNPQF
ncbi:MAG: transposase [Candidatus Aenigmarchaeota archaeon]|nr:transposase [Candidatus Aenigmarchaeota archaeon]